MDDVTRLPGIRIHQFIASGEIKATDVLNSFLEIIENENPQFNTILDTLGDLAGDQAESIDKDIADGRELPFMAGVPVVIKDNINIKDYPCTCGSRILEDYISLYDAHVIERLKAHRLPLIAKSNMDEFGMGSSNETSGFGPVKNPASDKHVPGGSSGGSAAAVAAHMAPLALGSDTAGSVRQPAAFCGLTGMRPTYGLVSRYGLVAFSSSNDQIGPITIDVRDNAALLGIIAGFDQRDSTSVKTDIPDYLSAIDKPIKGRRIAVPVECFDGGLDDDIAGAVYGCIDILKSEDVHCEEISIPSLSHAVAAYYIIADAEASSNLARYDGLRYGLSIKGGDLQESYINTRTAGFGAEVKRRIMLGTYVLSAGYYDAYYRRAQKVRSLIRDELNKIFAKFDMIITPTTPTPPFEFGSRLDDPLQMYLSDIYTAAAPLAGIPAVSIPCGKTDDGLPLAVQLTGPRLSESLLYNVAFRLESKLNENG